jgi:iron complex transport system permease protein
MGISLLPSAAFLGALSAVCVIYTLARLLPGGVRGPYAVYTLLLAGVVFNALAMAIVMILHSLMAPIDSQQVLFWMMGSLSVGRLSHGEYWSVLLIILIGTIWLVFRSGRLNLLAMGDDVARSLGLKVGASRMLFFVISSAIVGASVSASGMVGFVGLVVPHAIRLLLGADNRLLVPASALGGGSFMVFSDLLSRVSFHLFHSTLPVGVVTAFIGVPCFFIFLIKGLRSQNS